MSGRHPVSSSILRAALSLGAALVAAGCGGVTGVDGADVRPTPSGPSGPGSPTASILSITGGNDQSVLVNQIAGERLIVTLRDQSGAPLQNVPVSWTATDGGVVTPVAPTTNDAGEASATWQFGPKPGEQGVAVKAGDASGSFKGTATLNYRSVDAGGFHACAITPASGVYCWGYNGDGQLGINSRDNRNVPSPMVGNLAWRQVSGGRYHTCGITLNGILYCWGANVDGRLADGTLTPSNVPVQAKTTATFFAVGSGRNHSCALSLAGLAYCWGFNNEGEVGAVIPPADSVKVWEPRPVGARVYKTLAVGGLHSCAIDYNNQSWCWGFNEFGQLGDGTTAWTLNNVRDSTGKPLGSTPVATQQPAPFDSIAAGLYHTCALSAGQAYCWGDNREGQLGVGGTAGSLVPVPVAMPAGVSFASISAGDWHTCAVATDGQAYCWGNNDFGQFGDGTTTSHATPVTVASGLRFVSYSAGESVSCGVTTTNLVYCSGSNQYGQIGDATNVSRATPVRGAYQQ